MRKTISLMLAVAMLLSMGLSAAAAEPVASKSGTVLASYVPGEQDTQIISVDINWKYMEFTYHDASEEVWDPVNHTYGEAKEAAWEHSKAYISITNHSNAILQASIVYSPKDNKYKDMTLLFTNDQPYIGSAYTAVDAGKACNVTIRAIPDGKLDSDVSAGTEVGEIRVSVETVDNYATIMEKIGMYVDYRAKDAEHSRGDICYATQADYEKVESCYENADKVISESENAYEKNAALNDLITAYYNNLYFIQ